MGPGWYGALTEHLWGLQPSDARLSQAGGPMPANFSRVWTVCRSCAGRARHRRMFHGHLVSRQGLAGTATGELRFLSSRGRMAAAVIECGPRHQGPPLLVLSHVNQISTLRGRACMVTAGSLGE